MELTAVHVWLIVAAALVLLMTPGVAFFYGGMTRAKSTLNMMMMCFSALAITAVVWVLWGYSMTAGTSIGQIFGNPLQDFGLGHLVGAGSDPAGLITVGFAATFAIITVALIAGGVADRTKFSAWLLFVPLWVTFVYCPLAFMVWGGGLLSADGYIGQVFGEAIDYAGGTVVHINAGVAALVLALLVGKRVGFGEDPNQRPHSLPLVLIGATMLWIGWFGFNVGAATEAHEAGLIWVNTLLAPAAAMLAWMAVEHFRDGACTTLGAASGIVAGLVGITPACANVSVLGAVAIGVLCGLASAFAVGLKFKLGYDDSLDVVGVHLVSGLVGTVAIGFFALPVAGGTAGGLFYGGGAGQLVAQVVATLVAVGYSGVLTLLIGLLVKLLVGLRVTEDTEVAGVDLVEHAESAYEFGGVGVGAVFRPVPVPGPDGAVNTTDVEQISPEGAR
ncbi:ammonium transporter [Enemella sp. A6]|uniref:ammonium transporter n=1 Tax=Enemella sp. A6 TaxID=3440152 RepID=UPI003EBBC3DB